MLCLCSNTSFTCNKTSFSAPLPTHCTLTSVNAPIPTHYLNLNCPTQCPPIMVGPSVNHGISCNMYNGYNRPLCIHTPGHAPSCPKCSNPCSC